MFTFINITNVVAFGHRVAAVLEVLQARGVTADAVRAEFLAACENKITGQDAWERLDRLENPTAAELKLYAKVLQVNTTWLITGDVRFVPELMAGVCMCWEVPVEFHFTHYGATEPGSTHEYNPDCPVHGPETAAAGRSGSHHAALLNLVMTRQFPDITFEPAIIAAANPTDTEF